MVRWMEDHVVADEFARGLWRSVIPSEDPGWVTRAAELEPTDEPLGDYGPLVRRMREAGVDAAEIARFARIVGYEVAHSICYYLSDPNAAATEDHSMEGLAWQLYRLDPATDAPVSPIAWVHEILLALDPTGREMRPPPR